MALRVSAAHGVSRRVLQTQEHGSVPPGPSGSSLRAAVPAVSQGSCLWKQKCFSPMSFLAAGSCLISSETLS